MQEHEQRRRARVEETGSGDSVIAANAGVLVCMLDIAVAALKDRAAAESREGAAVAGRSAHSQK